MLEQGGLSKTGLNLGQDHGTQPRVGLELCINVLCTKTNIPTNIWFLLKNFSSFSMLVSYHQSDTKIEESDQIDAPKSKSTSCLEGDTEVYTFQLRSTKDLLISRFHLAMPAHLPIAF